MVLENRLEHLLSKKQFKEMDRVILEVISSEEKAGELELIRILERTKHPIIRNTIAIHFSDVRNPNALPVLLSLLRRKDTIKSRGSLVYAFGNYEYPDHLEIIELAIDLIRDGTYETCLEAMNLVSELEVEVSTDAWNRLKQKTLIALKSAEGINQECLEEVLEMFQ
ncbi:MAG: hypothetical protein AAF388_06685 [Bacteroidota bacterium]